ncbi:MAG: prenyltransferase [Myxococcota bacterium]
MSALAAWIRSARLASQSYIALPLLLGVGLAKSRGHLVEPWALMLVLLFGLLDQLYIVWANDYADQATDRLNQTPTIFSGGSRVLVEGRLSPGAIRRAAMIAGALALADALALGVARASPIPPLLAGAALILLWCYSYGPLRLSYRGGGELLQALGVGLVLPLYGFTAVSGGWAELDWVLLASLLPGKLACAIATTLPDEPSDRLSQKRTLAVLLGLVPAAWAATLLAAASISLLVWTERIPGATGAVFGVVLVLQATLQRSRPGGIGLWLRVFGLLLAVLGVEAVLVISSFHLIGV